jgi:hypothetical protein
MKPLFIAGLLGAVSLLAAQSAWADEPAPDKVKIVEQGPKGKAQSVPVDLNHLGAALQLYAIEAHRQRLARVVAGLCIGSALLPSGLVLLKRTDGVSRALVIGMVIGGSTQLATLPLLFIPTEMDRLRDKFMARPTNQESKATVREIEEEWRQAAETARSKRTYAGTGLVIGGGLGLAGGLAFLLAPEGLLGMSRQGQYTAGGVMMGIGAPVTTQGLRFLFEWSLEESSWEAYRAMKSDAESLARRHVPVLNVAATPGGGLATVDLAF